MDNFLTETVQSGDWKSEKHVPVIHVPEEIKKDEFFDITVSVGDEISHPNTLEHHIKWIKVFYKAEGAKFPIEIGSVNFTAHGESDLFTDYYGVVKTKVQGPGKIYALSYCNIHGLWQSSLDIMVN